jgi:hypothetical protein
MPDPINVIDDGTLPVKIRRQDGTEAAFTLDVMQARLAAQLVEKKHGAEQPDWGATAEFLSDLAQSFERLGVTGCTPTVAYQIWHRTAELWTELKKNMLGMPTSQAGTASTPSDSAVASAPA